LAARRFVDDNLAQEAVSFALDGLQAANWQRLQSFSGKSRFSTFLSSVVLRLFEDFARKRFGRLRPPIWLQKLGGIWLTLFRLLCQERLSRHEAVDNLAINRGHNRQELEETAATITGEIHDCGHARGHSQATEQEDLDYHAANKNQRHDDCESRLNSREKKLIFSSIFTHLTSNRQDTELAKMFSGLLQHEIKLKPQEKLLLKLCFQDGVAISEAGRMLGLSTHQVHGKLRRLLTKIRENMEKTGIAAELLELLRG
jgi:RNA polymerase sigma factor (sigma-70 family)